MDGWGEREESFPTLGAEYCIESPITIFKNLLTINNLQSVYDVFFSVTWKSLGWIVHRLFNQPPLIDIWIISNILL